mgnify:CR=1 FL=1|jgi:hypothetical protein
MTDPNQAIEIKATKKSVEGSNNSAHLPKVRKPAPGKSKPSQNACQLDLNPMKYGIKPMTTNKK